MQGLGRVNMKGKLSKRMGCGCCTFHNFKKLNVLNDKKSFKTEADCNFGKVNGIHEYPPLQKLFKDENVFITLDHPCGEDVIYIDGKFEGYANEWLNLYNYVLENNIKFNHYSEIYLLDVLDGYTT